MNKARVLVSILNWNNLQETLRCLESVHTTEGVDYDVVVVDNGSREDPAPAITGRYPQVSVIRNPQNIGFTGGHNKVLAQALAANYDFAWLLNSDAVCERDTLDLLLAEAERDPGLALCGPMIMDLGAPHTIQNCGSYIDWKTFSIVNTKSRELSADWHQCHADSICVWGTALLIRVEALRRVGLLDDRFFAYYEDTDLSARCNLMGYRNRTLLNARIFHSSPEDNRFRPPHYHYLLTRNKGLFWMKHLYWLDRIRWIRIYVMHTLRYAASCRDVGAEGSYQAAFAGMWDAFKGVHGPYNSSSGMPEGLVKLLMSHPYFLADLLEGRVDGLVQNIANSFKR